MTPSGVVVAAVLADESAGSNQRLGSASAGVETAAAAAAPMPVNRLRRENFAAMAKTSLQDFGPCEFYNASASRWEGILPGRLTRAPEPVAARQADDALRAAGRIRSIAAGSADQSAGAPRRGQAVRASDSPIAQ